MIDTTNNTIQTANALIYYKDKEGYKYLLVQEADKSWGLAGGAKDVEDADLIATLKRELKEEVGLDVSSYKIKKTEAVYNFTYSNKSSSRYGKKGIETIFAIEVFKSLDITLAEDISAFGWFYEEDAKSKLAEVDFFKYRLEQFIKAQQALGH